MKRFKREEPLRYEFAKPLDVSFYISRLRGEQSQSSRGKGVIRNISPGGLRLESTLDLPKDKEVEITFELDIAGHTIQPIGCIVWKEKSYDRTMYGVDFVSNEYEQNIIRALKDYPKNRNS
ncbi:PilZ domain-containing protein [Salipaludibacillus daqingensis]|uniref:PilZ domain-containing protein n=1 Tax=Salipaludibacillus daqingensis TaxID=3041001 RepID=UPI002475B7B8|nr:PilZ domain-containing protein [Salipaludibacillus daqingensis]